MNISNLPAIKDYLLQNIINFSDMKVKNTKKMEELVEQSKALQSQHTELQNSNQFIDRLINEIQQLKEGETIGTTEENIQST